MLSKKRWRPSLPLRYDSGVNNTSGPPSKHNDKPPSARFNRRNKNRSFSNGRLELSVHHPTPGLIIKDDWHTMGMRSTASNSTELKDAFVPESSVMLERPVLT